MIRINTLDIPRALFTIAALDTDKKCAGVKQYVAIEPDGEVSRLVATDGCRCHFALTHIPYDPGVYAVVTKNKKEVILELVTGYDTKDFPGYRCCLPALTGVEACASSDDGIFHAYAKTIRTLQEPFAIDFKYFTDALSLPCQVFVAPGPAAPITFKSEVSTAIVMPLRG